MACSEELSTLEQARTLFSFELICPPIDSFLTQKALLKRKLNSVVMCLGHPPKIQIQVVVVVC